jgi:hypothetical protein
MAATARRGGPPPFISQMQRAAAQRGRLDPLYQDVSDHLTRILQRLYPVWALIGPGLSDPGHIEIHSRWIYLDSDELLGSREAIEAGRLEDRAVLRTFGVALHETFHGKHTKRWTVERDHRLATSEDPAERQLSVDRRLLEEPRMEAHGCRDFPPASTRGRFVMRALQAAVTDLLLPRFAGELALAAASGEPVTRDMAGRSTAYLRARTRYGVIAPGALAALEAVWRRVLGAEDLRALDELYARTIWIADGDLDALDQAARTYREIIGPPDPPPAADATGQGRAGSQAGGGGDGDGSPTVGSLTDALERALEHARADQLEQLREDVSLTDLLGRVADAAAPTSSGIGTGAPTGRLPDRGVNRPPFPDEVVQARRYATRLRRAITLGTRRVDRRTPGGRFDGRAYARGRAQRAAGQPVTSHPWRVIRQVTAPIQEPHVALIIDTSGSMGGHEHALGPIAWILHTGLRDIGGRLAIALFGNGAELLSDGSDALRQVPGIKTGGGTAFAGDAIVLASEHLDMTNPRRPRFVYVISDGGWYDTHAGVEKIRWLAEHGVPTIHLSIGIAPLSVEADRIVVIRDPADALDRIAAETVEALRAAGTARRPH